MIVEGLKATLEVQISVQSISFGSNAYDESVIQHGAQHCAGPIRFQGASPRNCNGDLCTT
jgi:hypothetical protein